MSQRPHNDEQDELYPIEPEPVTPRAYDAPPELLDPGKQFVYRVFKPPGRKDYFSEAVWGFALPTIAMLGIAAGIVYFGRQHVVPMGLMILPIGAIGFGFSYMALEGMKQLKNSRGKGPAQFGLGLGFLEGVIFIAILVAMVLRRAFIED